MERKQAAELATASLEDTPSALQESSAANSSFASSETSGINTTITTSISSRKRPAAPPALKSFDAENTVLFIPTQLQQPPSQNDCGSILIDGDIISNHHPPISLDEESNHKNNSSNSCHHHEDDDEVDLITRNIVPQTDNPSLPCVTFRVIILGSFWCILLGFINSILVFRTNTFIVDAMLATLFSYPMGIAMAATLPTHQFSLMGGWWKFTLNPGAFNVKEHVLISIMGSAGAAGSYGVDNVVVQKSQLFIGHSEIGFGESLLWVLAIQFIGYGIAGLTRRFLVKPKTMIWPSILSQVALYTTLHESRTIASSAAALTSLLSSYSYGNGWKVPRFTFFWIAFAVIFIYTWIPEYFAVSFQTLSILCFMTADPILRFLGSADVGEGVGLGTLTFDLYYIGSRCLTTPFVYMLNYIAGNIIYAWIVVPVLHYTNAFNTPKLLNDDGSLHAVLNAPFLFNSSGYRIHAIDLYDPITFDLSLEKFNANKPIYITEYYAMDYTANFMTLSAMFSHVALFHGKEIVRQAKNAFGFTSTTTSSSSSSSSKEHSSSSSSLTFDIHNELMSHYPDIPEWGYLVYLVLCVGFLCAVVSTTSFSMPIWSVFLGVGICAAAILPIGIILAITGTTIYLTSMGQIIIGYLLPGKTIAVMAFVSLITNGASQAIILIGDLKLGHYMKVPPIAMVSCQLMGTILGSLSTLSGSWFVMTSMSDLIGKGDWQTNYYQTVYNSGAVWGAIGTDRFFGVETPYNRLLYGFIVGFLLPFVPWIGIKVYPRRFWLFINIPVILYYVGAGFFQNGIIVPFLVSFFFQYYLFKRHTEWWSNYNYVLAAALSAGVSSCVLVISVLKNFGIASPIWFLNPDIQNGQSVDWYCFS